jgi:hypothetical protein
MQLDFFDHDTGKIFTDDCVVIKSIEGSFIAYRGFYIVLWQPDSGITYMPVTQFIEWWELPNTQKRKVRVINRSGKCLTSLKES